MLLMSFIFVKHLELPCVERCYINKLALPIFQKKPVSPSGKLVQSLFSSSCVYLHCSDLLEQLSRLQALVPNGSGKTHRGTCILVRYITQHYISLYH